MIAMDNGRKVAPLAIEAAVLADPLFEQVLVFGDGRSRLAAIVSLHPQFLAKAQAATPQATVRQIVGNRLRESLQDRAQWEQIRDVGILPEPLRVERGELTAKHSLRRDVVRQRYEAIVEPLE
jgi:long-chain acyl-CoA synthetase